MNANSGENLRGVSLRKFHRCFATYSIATHYNNLLHIRLECALEAVLNITREAFVVQMAVRVYQHTLVAPAKVGAEREARRARRFTGDSALSIAWRRSCLPR